MGNQKVTVLAIFKAKPGKEEQLYEQLYAQSQRARSDPGCLLFECKKNRDDKSLFLFHEEWTSQADVENHLKMPYLAEYRKNRAPYLDGEPQVSAWLH
ncbi:MAG: antibiotic biosynthesis monooxygenase [Desulfohalobiaceae bacterium]|nr:antibiotic biosynthesis monooxygenase [Desulfohalobiaceae bacterium]